jgi:hypothetical protein
MTTTAARPAAETPTGATVAVRERFLSLWMCVVLGACGLFSLTFAKVHIHDDGVLYYYFVRRLFGADIVAQAYQFGSSFWTAPFYLASQLVASRGELDHNWAGQVGTVVASNVATGLTLYLGWRILRELDLPRTPGVLMLALFGTPLFFYTVFEPGLKHAADTLYFTTACWFLLLAFRNPRTLYLLAIGGCFGVMLATRYANLAIPAGAVVMFAAQRAWRPLWIVLTTTAVVGACAYAVPVVRDIPFSVPRGTVPTEAASYDAPRFLAAPSTQRLAAGIEEVPGSEGVSLDLLVPPKMLFTLHRGLYVWTPLTLLATVGFVLLLRRDRRHRWYLAGLAGSGLALLAIHSLWADFWDGGTAFSARFLTALFPLFLLGTAELVQRFGGWAYGGLAVCAAFSVWVGLVVWNGFDGQATHNSITDIVRNYTGPHRDPPPHDSFGNFGHELRVRIEDRWGELWQATT